MLQNKATYFLDHLWRILFLQWGEPSSLQVCLVIPGTQWRQAVNPTRPEWSGERWPGLMATAAWLEQSLLATCPQRPSDTESEWWVSAGGFLSALKQRFDVQKHECIDRWCKNMWNQTMLTIFHSSQCSTSLRLKKNWNINTFHL